MSPDESFTTDTILIRGVPIGKDLNDVFHFLNGYWAVDMRPEQVVARGVHNHFMVRGLTSLVMRNMIDSIDGTQWEEKKLHLEPFEEATPMKDMTDANMRRTQPDYYQTLRPTQLPMTVSDVVVSTIVTTTQSTAAAPVRTVSSILTPVPALTPASTLVTSAPVLTLASTPSLPVSRTGEHRP